MKNGWVITKEMLKGKDRKVRKIIIGLCNQNSEQNWVIDKQKLSSVCKIVPDDAYKDITTYPEETPISKASKGRKRKSTGLRIKSRNELGDKYGKDDSLIPNRNILFGDRWRKENDMENNGEARKSVLQNNTEGKGNSERDDNSSSTDSSEIEG